MNPARYMWTSSCQRFGLNSASNGRTSVTSPFEPRSKPCGLFIQPLTAMTRHEPPTPEIAIGMPAEEVRARREAVPPVDVDRDEDRLAEEEQALDREGEAEDLAPLLHEPRPQQPELEREDRPGHDPDREQDQHHLRPALGERP